MDAPTKAVALAGSVLGAVDNSFVIAEWRDAGGPPIPPRWIAPLHVHHQDDEAWYVLEGTLGVRIGEEEVVAGAGSGVLAPRGKAHTYWNAGEGPLRYLLVMTPNIHKLIQEIHATKDRSREGMQALFRRHNSELL